MPVACASLLSVVQWHGKLGHAVVYHAFAWVSHVHLAVCYLIYHHKMVLVPVYDARQGNILAQRSHRHPARRGLHAYLSCGHADTLERHTLACDTHLLPQILHRIVASIMGCHHLQTGWPTVHSVQLVYYTQSAHNEDLLKKCLLNPKFDRPLMSSMEFSLM